MSTVDVFARLAANAMILAVVTCVQVWILRDPGLKVLRWTPLLATGFAVADTVAILVAPESFITSITGKIASAFCAAFTVAAAIILYRRDKQRELVKAQAVADARLHKWIELNPSQALLILRSAEVLAESRAAGAALAGKVGKLVTIDEGHLVTLDQHGLWLRAQQWPAHKRTEAIAQIEQRLAQRDSVLLSDPQGGGTAERWREPAALRMARIVPTPPKGWPGKEGDPDA